VQQLPLCDVEKYQSSKERENKMHDQQTEKSHVVIGVIGFRVIQYEKEKKYGAPDEAAHKSCGELKQPRFFV